MKWRDGSASPGTFIIGGIMSRLFRTENALFEEMGQMLARLRAERQLSTAERNLLIYLEGLMRIRRWSGDLEGFLPHLRALARGGGRDDTETS
jgi:hypothetical protein